MLHKLQNGMEVEVREIKLSDAQAGIDYMVQVNSETKNLTREPDEFALTLEQEEKFIKNMLESENNFTYTVWYQGELICMSGFHGSSLRRLKHKVSLGISVLKDFHNLGLGTLMMELLVDKAKELGKTKIELEVRSDNPNAIKVYKRTGFEVEGTRKNGFKVDDKYVDLILMGRVI